MPFTSTLRGTAHPVSRWALLTRPLAQLRVAALIKWEGIRLWRKGVPVQPRSGDDDLERQVAGNLVAEPAAEHAA